VVVQLFSVCVRQKVPRAPCGIICVPLAAVWGKQRGQPDSSEVPAHPLSQHSAKHSVKHSTSSGVVRPFALPHGSLLCSFAGSSTLVCVAWCHSLGMPASSLPVKP
jgi:hypothetical protein